MAELGDLLWADGLIWIYCGNTLKWSASSKDGVYIEGLSKKKLKKFDDYCLIIKNGEFVVPREIAAAWDEGYKRGIQRGHKEGQKDAPYMMSYHLID